MPVESSPFRSWLKPTTSPKTNRRPLQCEQLEDRLTPSSAALQPTVAPYLPPSEFLFGAAESAPSGSAPLTVAFNYLGAHAAEFGISAGDLAHARVTDQYRDDSTGISHIYLRQTVNGLEVENANIAVAVARDGRVISAGGGFVAGLAARIGAGAVAPSLTPSEAVQKAADALGVATTHGITVVSAPTGTAHSTVISASDVSLDPITAQLHYVPTADGGAVLSWDLIIRTTDHDHWYDLSVADVGGSMVSVIDWSDTEAVYNVVARPNAAPDDGGFTLQTDPEDTTASPYGWHDTDGIAGAEFTDTRGNNVDAHLDLDADDVADADQGGPARPDGGSGLDFSGYSFLPAQDATTTQNQNIAQVNLFYSINTAHDIQYRYGFTEAAGNFQTNNYGAGGAGGDAVEGDAQDGSGTDNANFSTPPDGMTPRMQQYVFDVTPILRDSDLDNSVIFHEYGHGVSNRLTGGPATAGTLNALQSGGMGEGWSDFYALMMLQQASDTAGGAYGIATYVMGDVQSGPGVRAFPYSTDRTIDPLTFDAYGLSGTTSYGVARSTEVHDAGTIWAAALWDMNWKLIGKYGYDADLTTGWSATSGGAAHAGNKLAFELVNEAMKLQPSNPSFIEARDAILAADIALNGGEDQLEIWQAFAGRGLGIFASTANSGSSSVTIDFTVPPQLTITAQPLILEGDSGSQGATFTVRLSAPSTRTVTVRYATVDGTATAADGDYAPASGLLTFAPGTTFKEFNVQVFGDTKYEGNETFSVVLSSPVKAFIVTATGTATVGILNDDAAPPGTPTGPAGPAGPAADLHTLAAATQGGVVAEVRALDPTSGNTRWSRNPFDGFAGAVSIAVGDANGDRTWDVVVGAGAGANPRVVVLDGADGHEIRSFFAFAAGFAGGVTVASGDVNGDGYDDIIVGADTRGYSHVKVFDGRTLEEIRSFYAFRSDYEYGVRVAAADVNGDGRADIFVSGGPGSLPQVRIFDGATGAILRDLMAFAPDFAGGVFIAAGDVDGDGYADAIVGAGTRGLPHVKVFSGATGAELASFYVNEEFAPNAIPSIPYEGGISVGSADIDGDGVDEILTGKGNGTRSILRSFRLAQRNATGTAFTGLQAFAAKNVFEGYYGGISVGG